ncbi:MAG TPA: hypothetical protein VFI62_11300, partial [Burkholderiales bacterium]|nr:hypothetical protein [Burkholderiales bacterium]
MEMQIPAAILEARQQPTQPTPLLNGFTLKFSPQLTATFDTVTGAMWSRWSADARPCFNPRLLADIRAYYAFLAESAGRVRHKNEEHAIEYVVLASAMPGVFNLGGDLDLFKQLIGAQDRAGLLRYGRACIDVLYRNYIAHELPAVSTI